MTPEPRTREHPEPRSQHRTTEPALPVSGEQHERAVEAAQKEYGLLLPGRVFAAYLASLREQGVRLVDLREVAALLRSHDCARRVGRPSSECVALLVERRFGGNERSE